MHHNFFAELDSDNKVVNIIVVSDEDLIDENGNVNEQFAINNLNLQHGERVRIMTSDEGNFRGHMAGKGDTYDENLDLFISPQTYPSWILNTQTGGWDPPTPRPEFTQEEIDSYCWYEWNEDQYQLDNNTGWELRYPN